MTLILDAAPLVALADAKEPQLEALLRIRDEEEGPLVLPAPVAAEVDYLLGVRFGHAPRRAFLSDLAARYDVACLEVGDYQAVAELDARYSDLGPWTCRLLDRGSCGALRNPARCSASTSAISGPCAASGRVIQVVAGGFLTGLPGSGYFRLVARSA